MASALSSTPPDQRLCSEAALDALCNEISAYYFNRQEEVSPSAAVDAIGYRIGRALAERASLRFRDGLRHPTTLDAVKHACKEIWNSAFGKQVDALRTNHRGTFVLRDAAFRRLASLSADASVSSSFSGKQGGKGGGGEEPAAAAAGLQQRDATAPALAAAVAAATALRLHAGVVRGALSALGVEADVTAASPVPPAAEFTVIVRSDGGE